MNTLNPRILIIDDDARNIFALSAVLKSRGYAIESAMDAAQGIATLRNDKEIKLVLMDMMLPDMDGYEAISYIRQDSMIPFVPIISVTAQAMPGDKEKCIAAGADDYVSKPVQIDTLLQIMTKYLD